MDEKDPQLNHEEETIPLDRQIRDLATQIGIEETPEITEILKPANERTIQGTTEELEAAIDKLKENHPEATFMAWRSLILAAHHIQSAYNDLLDASSIMENENSLPEVSAKIEALMEQL